MIETLQAGFAAPAVPNPADPTRWGHENGAAIGPELSLLEPLGGGDRYES